jgi:hypothetical protein
VSKDVGQLMRHNKKYDLCCIHYKLYTSHHPTLEPIEQVIAITSALTEGSNSRTDS